MGRREDDKYREEEESVTAFLASHGACAGLPAIQDIRLEPGADPPDVVVRSVDGSILALVEVTGPTLYEPNEAGRLVRETNRRLRCRETLEPNWTSAVSELKRITDTIEDKVRKFRENPWGGGPLKILLVVLCAPSSTFGLHAARYFVPATLRDLCFEGYCAPAKGTYDQIWVYDRAQNRPHRIPIA